MTARFLIVFFLVFFSSVSERWVGREQESAGGVSTTQPSPTVLEVVRHMLKQVRAKIRFVGYGIGVNTKASRLPGYGIGVNTKATRVSEYGVGVNTEDIRVPGYDIGFNTTATRVWHWGQY